MDFYYFFSSIFSIMEAVSAVTLLEYSYSTASFTRAFFLHSIFSSSSLCVPFLCVHLNCICMISKKKERGNSMDSFVFQEVHKTVQ
jgi:hypothetical protein